MRHRSAHSSCQVFPEAPTALPRFAVEGESSTSARIAGKPRRCPSQSDSISHTNGQAPAGFLPHLAHAVVGPVVVVAPGEKRQTTAMVLKLMTITVFCSYSTIPVVIRIEYEWRKVKDAKHPFQNPRVPLAPRGKGSRFKDESSCPGFMGRLSLKFPKAASSSQVLLLCSIASTGLVKRLQLL